MQKELTPETLDNIDRLGVVPDRATVLALVAECRELRRLKSALEFLEDERQNARLVTDYRRPGEHDCACEVSIIIARAQRLGWKEGT